MSASWSRPTSSPRNIRGITNGNRKRHGRPRTHGLADAAGMAAVALSWLDRRADAGAGVGARVAPPLGRDLPVLLSPRLLPHPRAPGAPDRPPGEGAAGALCG